MSRIAIVIALCAISGAALAQNTPPAYPEPFTSLPDAETNTFHQWGLNPTLVVSTAELQAVLNAQSGGANFVALSDVGPGLSSVSLGSFLERIDENASGESSGPISDVHVSTTALNMSLGQPEAVYLGYWSTDAEFNDALYGAPVSTQVDVKLEIKHENERQIHKLRVRGSDGFEANLKYRTPHILGVRFRLDPIPVSFRFLTDGPAGSHPSAQVALECDVIFAAPGEFDGLRPGDVLKLRGGRLRIKSVQPGLVARSCATRTDVD
jgi:hypothetical protein